MLLFTTLALSAQAKPHEPPERPGHEKVVGHAAKSERAGAAESGEAGGEHASGGAGAHHVTFTDDDDHDGTPNWRDSDSEGYQVSRLAWHVLNFSVLVGILVYALRRPTADLFRERALGIRHELTDSARARDEAHQRHQEVLARLDKIEHEVQVLETEAKADAQREEAKLVERAQREATRIAEQAERNIRDEAARARQSLRREAVELAVQLAEGTLRKGVSADDQQNLARQFLASVAKGDDRV